jgi:RNA polymerase sigma-54 factor
VLLQQEQRQVVVQRIDPKIIMANTILQLTSMELNQTIENEIMENPALETLDEVLCDGNCVDPASCPHCSARKHRDNDEVPLRETPDSGDHETEYESLFGTNIPDNDDDYDPVSNLEAEMTLQEHLRGLLRAAVSGEDYWIGEYLIHNLDDKGWLGDTVDNIAFDLGVEPDKVLEILQVLQSFDPPGVGARDLRECLLLQLRFLREESPENTVIGWAEVIVEKAWDHVVAKRYPKIARACALSQDEVKQASEYIRAQLNPNPAGQFRPPWTYRPTNHKVAVRPDVMIRRTELGYEVDVLGVEPYALSITTSYRELYAQIKKGIGHHSEETKKHITEYVERAELFIRNLNQRRHTLRMITKCIIDCQMGYLETGSRQFLRPLTRTQVAKMLSIHESTVSRATANKFVQLPNQDVVGFNIFFNSSLSIKDAIEEIIQEEDSSNPLSDQQIADKLRDRGINVARRTIVKYREAQKILSSTRRRR